MMTRDELNELTETIIGAAIRVHKELGPGLLESVYEKCLAFELRDRGIEVEEQVPMPVKYRSVRVDCGFRLDLRVKGEVIVETKAVHTFSPIDGAKLMTQMKLSGSRVGLLINFNVKYLSDGIKRLVNGFPD